MELAWHVSRESIQKRRSIVYFYSFNFICFTHLDLLVLHVTHAQRFLFSGWVPISRNAMVAPFTQRLNKPLPRSTNLWLKCTRNPVHHISVPHTNEPEPVRNLKYLQRRQTQTSQTKQHFGAWKMYCNAATAAAVFGSHNVFFFLSSLLLSISIAHQNLLLSPIEKQ